MSPRPWWSASPTSRSARPRAAAKRRARRSPARRSRAVRALTEHDAVGLGHDCDRSDRGRSDRGRPALDGARAAAGRARGRGRRGARRRGRRARRPCARALPECEYFHARPERARRGAGPARRGSARRQLPPARGGAVRDRRAVCDVHGRGDPGARRPPGLRLRRSKGWGGRLALRPDERSPPEPPHGGHGGGKRAGRARAPAALLPGSSRLVSAPGGARAAALAAALPGTGPVLIARAPGRVNVIGEHTDYNGLPVLPFAIDHDVLVAARRQDTPGIEVANVDPRFPPFAFQPRAPVPPRAAGDWGNYVQAACEALLGAGITLPRGAALRVDGAIPPAAGVSSSSALVVASGLALAALAGASLDPLALADLLARGEQYVGTLSGGMDQAAILLARPSHALRLDFFPLRARPVAVPPHLAFVVAHTLDEAAKSGAVAGLYNQRVIECRLACAVLAGRPGRPPARLADVPDAAAVLTALPDLLPEGAVTRRALTTWLGLDRADVDRLAPPSVSLADPDRFVLRARVRHVLSEAGRVSAAERALRDGDLPALGGLLDESHASGAADYATSTPAADALVVAARAAGAAGARLMGAGFGGSALLVVARERTPALLDALDRRFYAPRSAAPMRFVVTPSAGASVARVDCP